MKWNEGMPGTPEGNTATSSDPSKRWRSSFRIGICHYRGNNNDYHTVKVYQPISNSQRGNIKFRVNNNPGHICLIAIQGNPTSIMHWEGVIRIAQ